MYGLCSARVADKQRALFDELPTQPSPLTELAASHQGSGVALLADPAEALQSRLQLAALATPPWTFSTISGRVMTVWH